jgi:hypothetical protein
MPRHRSPREEIGEAKTALERINANCESSVHSRGAFHVLYLAIFRLTVRPQVNSERTHWPRGTAYVGQDRQPVGGGAGRQVFCLPIFPSADTSPR